MKIGVVGCGALGSFYGAKLCQTGHELHFLLRSDYATVRDHGVQILSDQGDFHVRPAAASDPKEIGPCELVIIGLKTTANDQFGSLLPPLIDDRTAVLTLQNGLGNEADVAAWVAPENILGGLCFVCLNRIAPGRIHHIAHGAIVMGEYARAVDSRTHRIADLFKQSGIACSVTDDLERSHWEKLVWNIPFNGLGVGAAAGHEAVVRGDCVAGSELGPCWPTDALLEDPKWHSLVKELMDEVIATAQALGLPIDASVAERQIARTYEMGAYKASTLIDFERGGPLELEALFMKPMREAQRIGVAVPRLEALCTLLQSLGSPKR